MKRSREDRLERAGKASANLQKAAGPGLAPRLGPGKTTLALAIRGAKPPFGVLKDQASVDDGPSEVDAGILLGMTLMDSVAPMRPAGKQPFPSCILEGPTSFGIPTSDAFDYYLLEPGAAGSGAPPTVRLLPAFFARPRLPAKALLGEQDRFLELVTNGYTAAAPSRGQRQVSAPAAGAERIDGASAERLAQTVADTKDREENGGAQSAAIYVSLPPFNLQADTPADCYPLEGLLARDVVEYATGYGAGELCRESREACILAAPLSEAKAADLLKQVRSLADKGAEGGDGTGAKSQKRPGLTVPTSIDRQGFEANGLVDLSKSLLLLTGSDASEEGDRLSGGTGHTALFNILVTAIACIRNAKFDAPDTRCARFLQRRFGAKEVRGKLKVPNDGYLLNYTLVGIWHLTDFQVDVGRVSALLALNEAVISRTYRCLGASISARNGNTYAVLSLPFRPNMEGSSGRRTRRRR